MQLPPGLLRRLVAGLDAVARFVNCPLERRPQVLQFALSFDKFRVARFITLLYRGEMRFFLTDALPKVGYGWRICDRRYVEKLFGRVIIAVCCLGVIRLELESLGLGCSYTQV